jgi:hypothetical protein
LTANDLEADALVAVALTKLGEEAVDSLAKEALGSPIGRRRGRRYSSSDCKRCSPKKAGRDHAVHLSRRQERAQYPPRF